jgi:hypothetical protein
VIPEDFHDFFLGVTGAAGALVGLLFVAISVAPERVIGPTAQLLHQIRASSALTALLSPLVISLIALIPGASIGYATLSFGAFGLLFVAATAVRLWRAREEDHRLPVTVGLLSGFLAVMVIEVVFGIKLVAHSGDIDAVRWIAGALVGSLAIGVDRAWELVGARRRSVTMSLRDLFGSPPRED